MKRLLFTFVAIVILLGLLELTSRLILNHVYNRKFDSSLIVDNKYFTSSGLKENATGMVWGKPFHTDEFGCRKTPVAYAPKKKKWLFIGDSVTEGVGVDDSSTFAALVAQHIDSVNIMNYSLIGYSVSDYLDVIKSLVKKKDSDITRVTIFFCLNDVYGPAKSGQLPVMAKQNFLGKLNGLMQDNYATYKLIKLTVYQLSDSYFRYDEKFYTKGNAFFNDAMLCLRDCDSICKNAGVKMNVIVLPYRSQLGNEGNKTMPQFMIKWFCRDHNIDCDYVSTRDVGFIHASFSSPLYLFADEIHFSEEGHKTIACYILSH